MRAGERRKLDLAGQRCTGAGEGVHGCIETRGEFDGELPAEHRDRRVS
jgi:hypothetical protein